MLRIQQTSRSIPVSRSNTIYSMHGALSFSRRLIPWGFDCRIELSIDAPKDGLGTVCDSAIHQLLPAGALHSEAITDIKGRDAQQILDASAPASLLPKGEELFFVAGRTATPEEELPAVTPEKLTEPFAFTISSAFEGFIGAHHIVHRTALERRGACADFIDVQRVGRIWPLVIDRFRLGLQLFRSRRTLAFGYAPSAERTVLIDADQTAIRILIEIERLNSKDLAAVLSDDIVRTVDSIVQRACGEDLAAFLRSAAPV